MQQPSGTIGSHAGQKNADGLRAGGLRRRIEEHVHGRAMPVHPSTGRQYRRQSPAAALYAHMPVTGRNQDATRDNGHAILRLAYIHPAQVRQTFRIQPGEHGRHVQDSHDAGHGMRHILEDGIQRFRRTSRPAKHEYRRTDLQAVHPPVGIADQHRAICLRGGLELGLELRSELRDILDGPGVRLGHKVKRAGTQRVKHGATDRTDDDNRNRILRHDAAHELDAAHAGHLDIEGNHIRPKRLDTANRILRIHRLTDNMQPRLIPQASFQGFPE